MDTATLNSPSSMGTQAPGFFARTEAWLDARGRAAWITAMIGGYIVFWPVGLALTAYMVINNKFSGSHSRKGCHRSRHSVHMNRATGNAAFDSYKDETLRRLEEEQSNFEEFLERLREAKDKAEFDQFMDERGTQTRSDDKTDSAH
jgi:hypothetical protein